MYFKRWALNTGSNKSLVGERAGDADGHLPCISLSKVYVCQYFMKLIHKLTGTSTQGLVVRLPAPFTAIWSQHGVLGYN